MAAYDPRVPQGFSAERAFSIMQQALRAEGLKHFVLCSVNRKGSMGDWKEKEGKAENGLGYSSPVRGGYCCVLTCLRFRVIPSLGSGMFSYSNSLWYVRDAHLQILLSA